MHIKFQELILMRFFFIVTSHKPTGGNAKCMCHLAEGDIVDKIVDVTIDRDYSLLNSRAHRSITFFYPGTCVVGGSL